MRTHWFAAGFTSALLIFIALLLFLVPASAATEYDEIAANKGLEQATSTRIVDVCSGHIKYVNFENAAPGRPWHARIECTASQSITRLVVR